MRKRRAQTNTLKRIKLSCGEIKPEGGGGSGGMGSRTSSGISVTNDDDDRRHPINLTCHLSHCDVWLCYDNGALASRRLKAADRTQEALFARALIQNTRRSLFT